MTELEIVKRELELRIDYAEKVREQSLRLHTLELEKSTLERQLKEMEVYKHRLNWLTDRLLRSEIHRLGLDPKISPNEAIDKAIHEQK